MRSRPGAKRLTWHPELQLPFESGWSIFHKVRVLNNLRDYELVRLIAREPVVLKKGRLRDCADSSWIDFDRFSELLDVPERELRNGFWDQLGIPVQRPKEYELRLCKMCWELHRYHCVLFDLVWMRQCPWHGLPIGLPKDICVDSARSIIAQGEPPATPFNDLISLEPIGMPNRYRLIGHVVEYLEWWRAVQGQVPQADWLLRRLVSTSHMTGQNEAALRWQAGFARSKSQPAYGSWILEGVKSTPCLYSQVTDAGRYAGHDDDRSTVCDDTGHAYRAIRRHLFRRYVRRHRSCLRRLAWLSRDQLLSLVAEGVCATCLAYVVWRMSVETLVVIEGLFTRRTKNFELRLTEPFADSPSDDPTRLRFTYMQFFGIWAAIVDSIGLQGLRVSIQDTVSSPQVLFARDETRPVGSPLRTFHCIYPSGDELAVEAGHPCRATWKLLPYEQQCVLRSQAWLGAFMSEPKSLVEIYLENKPDGEGALGNLWV